METSYELELQTRKRQKQQVNIADEKLFMKINIYCINHFKNCVIVTMSIH